jgi:predicted NUDIX family NTP pyrophosphohydrolase
MPRPHSAGVLLYRRQQGELQVLLIKPGGPFWRKRDVGAWMIPKGMVEQGETALEAAIREFKEEVGVELTETPVPLCEVRQAGGKIVDAFALEGDLDASKIRSVYFKIEWPPRSGGLQSFPEVSEGRWMHLAEARRLMLPSQLPMLDALEEKLKG